MSQLSSTNEYFRSGVTLPSLWRVDLSSLELFVVSVLSAMFVQPANADQQVSEAPATSPQTVRPVDRPAGRVLVGVVSSADNSCKPLPGPPFDAESVAQAYWFAKSRRKYLDFAVTQGQAEVVIVDNGFFGADPNMQDIFSGSPFTGIHFKKDLTSRIAKRLNIAGGNAEGRFSWPLNISNEVETNVVSGHGTHVAGLVLGGPNFLAYRDNLYEDQVAWTLLTIVNIGRGKSELISGSEDLLRNALGADSPPPKIVNFSIAYDGQVAPSIQDTFQDLFRKSNESLFVVAAGNAQGGRGRDVTYSLTFPAAHGGVIMDNVITVAALEGAGRLASFSNYGVTGVDLAAPGCEIASWITNKAETVKMSGTSQAAPLVTFAASLLKSIANEVRPRQIKARLVSSGDLLDPSDQELLAFQVGLNIPKALYWFDDYLNIDGEKGGEYLGTAQVPDLVCTLGDGQKKEKVNQSNLFAFKQDHVRGWIFRGKATHSITQPCRWQAEPGAMLDFKATHQVKTKSVQKLPDAIDFHVPMSAVVDLVLRTKF